MTRRPIQQLSPTLVNRIAAGEVIERPASVVKELVENAIDAGATSIVVEIEDGGRALIRVTDDGGGIPVDELPLAFASHATSKLATDDDLFNIVTMGFRGEALASIGSVSHARVCSRTRDAVHAFEIFNRGGAISDPQASAGNVGTCVEIRNLFFNTPARRKFLKGSPTEFGHISEMLRRLALPHASIHFRLLHNDRLVFDLPATTAEERWLSAWPDDFREQRLPVNLRDGEITLRGLIGLPELARPTQKYQFLYLNSRPIRDKFLQHALREAYRGLTEPGRHPAAIVMLDMPPQDVDVNVHPTKFEVRFKDSGRLHGMMLAGVREQLLGADLTPAAVARRDDATPEPQRQDMRSTLAEFFRQMPAQQPLLAGGADSTTAGAMPMPPAAQPPAAGIFPPAASRTPPEGFSPRAPEPSPFLPAPSAAIQLHNTYLVAQSDEGMIIIDQHALHERIMYEELWTRVQRGPLESQRMLIPQPIRVSSTQMALCEQIKPLLMRLGIEVEQFGPESLAVQAFPSFLEKLDPALFVRELLERGEQELLDLHDEELLHGIMDMMACKAAVKAGDPLTTPEIEALLARRELVERSSNCPHGRPTTLRLSLRDLEKQFKRTGF